jgi:hypothetical protein
MAGKDTATAAFGILPDRMSMETVLACLKSEGFHNSDVSLLFRENRGTWTSTQPKNPNPSVFTATNTGTGPSVHGALRWLNRICPIAIPGQGTFVAVGPIMSALEGTAFGNIHGKLAGSLVGMGLPVTEAKRYEVRIASSWFLLSVRCTDSQCILKAKKILSETRAQDVYSTGMSESVSFASWHMGFGDEPQS